MVTHQGIVQERILLVLTNSTRKRKTWGQRGRIQTKVL